ncbi:hypothetical protein N7478_000374 [Penicillium angulare]|uniref:uncharacterized protein n=1 Tax=Penicillium angulare TaxID=116970 RepID=UPI0025419DFA|nr:uncharacterized protein N7478_000374 [Penicillium angulare]KAJ5291123.1 hypothetical protein N7478_000374 [Penicillium angulare]
MTVSVSIGPADLHDSDSSYTEDEEDSSVVQVSHHPSDGSHDFLDDEEWANLSLSYPDEVKSADPASRPRTSHRNRSLYGSRSASGPRQQSRRQMNTERDFGGSRARRHSPDSPGSPDSEEEEHNFPRGHGERRWHPQHAQQYTQSVSSGPSYNNQYPPGHAPFPHQDSLVQVRPGNHNGQPYPSAAYPYGPPHGAHPMGPYFQEQMHGRHPQQPPQPRMDPHNHPQHLHHMGAPGVPSPFAGTPFHHELMPYGPNGYYNNYRDPYSMFPGMMPPSYFPYPQVPSPAQAEAKSPPTPAPDEAHPEAAKDTTKDEAIARLEKLILDERTERENKEAARLAAIEAAAAEKLAREKQLAHDTAIAEAAASSAATMARTEAEKRAAEEAAKAKEEAEKAAAEAAVKAKEDAEKAATDAATKALEAAGLAAAKAKEEEEAKNKVPPPEKKKPIKFKDAVGRKFSFPFELCATWQGMEDLIKQAFLHIEVIGPHVAEGHYDLVGPNGDIILPQVWETVVEPDWLITMHMWPIPEKPKEPDPPPAADPPAAAPAKSADGKKKDGTKKAPPPGFAGWMMGRRAPPRPKKAPKAEKKEEPPAQ